MTWRTYRCKRDSVHIKVNYYLSFLALIHTHLIQFRWNVNMFYWHNWTTRAFVICAVHCIRLELCNRWQRECEGYAAQIWERREMDTVFDIKPTTALSNTTFIFKNFRKKLRVSAKVNNLHQVVHQKSDKPAHIWVLTLYNIMFTMRR